VAPGRLKEILPPHTALAFEAMRALRSHHEDEAAFVRRVDEVQRPQGYRLVGAFEDGRCVAVSGFRVIHNLAWGDCLYVDDLSTHPEGRRRGYGRALLEWCGAEAGRLGCTELHLDSGVGPEREDAHRLYFNTGLRITSYHFAKRVEPAVPPGP
jgi:GNAT superfamily N-acetyltransferase